MRCTPTLVLGLLLVMLAPASVGAGQPDQVDPALMQPAVNPTCAVRLLAQRP